jgi:glycerol uptake facilitator-like aquaporin
MGTAFLVFIGCGTLTASSYLVHGKSTFTIADLLPVAVAFGLALAVMVYAIGHISDCHINPAVSFGLACVGRMPWSEAGAYIVAQILGGIVGAFLVAVTFGGAASPAQSYGATEYAPQFVIIFRSYMVGH